MCKRVINRVRKEFAIRENIKNGFSRRAASQWYNKEKETPISGKMYTPSVS